MLVLTRRLGESIVIDEKVRISVLEVRGDRIRLGIEAPRHVLVDREEVHERRKQFSESSEPPVCVRRRRHSQEDGAVATWYG
jgi:carbon storage regulator